MAQKRIQRLNKFVMNCIECGETIENGTYFCENCGAHFCEEDIEVMLHVWKKSEKKRARKTYGLAFLFFSAFVAMLLGVVFFVNARMVKKNMSREQNYYAKLESLFSNEEMLNNYSYTKDSVNLCIDLNKWMELSENDKALFGEMLSQKCTQFKQESGYNDPTSVIIQINDENDNMVLYVDRLGYVQTFD